MEQKVFRNFEIGKLISFIRNFDQNKIFLVRANKSYHTSGADGFINQLTDGAELVSFYNFDTNPQLEDLKKGISLFKQGKYELIIAIGGGSVLDMAKLISVLAHQQESIEDIASEKSEIKEKKTPLIAIPTTAGTGAEATQFGVLYMGKKKYSIGHPIMLPEAVYLSSQFSLSASSYLTACTGVDAFCQAVESIWSVNASYESEKYALNAIDIIWHNLHNAVQKNETRAKDQMQEGAFLAGKAINITKTTAPHALSYAFTSYYNIPHGHAVALSLPYFLAFNYRVTDKDCSDPRGAHSVIERMENMLNELDLRIDEAPAAFVNFFESLGMNTKLNTLIDKFDPKIITENVNIERLNNNPRRVTSEVIANFLSY